MALALAAMNGNGRGAEGTESCELEYSTNEIDFVTALGVQIGGETANQGEYCCVREFMAVEYAPWSVAGREATADRPGGISVEAPVTHRLL